MGKRFSIASHCLCRKKEMGSRKKGTEEALLGVLRDPFLKDYLYRFLERNFYRNFNARMRAKPDEILWQLWFGSGKLHWGLIISPALRLGQWTNDKSQMRREDYEYWTIGHVLQTGLIDPEQTNPLEFKDIDALYSFYLSVIKRTSNSEHEKAIIDRYIAFAKESNNPLEIPFLIPELRYAGKEKEHEYRLDFTVLNPYTMSLTGFEISPASSHVSIKGIRSKTQKVLNSELSEKWSKEMSKRNSYFKGFGISTITFTDDQLLDLDNCFQQILEVLVERPKTRITLDSAEKEFLDTCAKLNF